MIRFMSSALFDTSSFASSMLLDTGRETWEIEPMVALQKWLNKQKHFKLPKHSVAREVERRFELKPNPSFQDALHACHRHLLNAPTQVLVCKGSACADNLPCPMGPKTLAALSQDPNLAVKPVGCMGHCGKGSNFQVVHKGNVRLFTHFSKEKQIQALFSFAKILGDHRSLAWVPQELAAHVKGKVKEV